MKGRKGKKERRKKAEERITQNLRGLLFAGEIKEKSCFSATAQIVDGTQRGRKLNWV